MFQVSSFKFDFVEGFAVPLNAIMLFCRERRSAEFASHFVQSTSVIQPCFSTYLILFAFLFIFPVSCRRYNTQQPAQDTTLTERQKIEEALLRVNQQLVEDDDREIEMFVERKGWQMQTTGSGLRYMFYERGRGEKVVTGKVVTLAYTVSLLDSTICYSSEQLGPKKFRLGHGGVERGLEEGVLLMRVGDKARMIMPPHLAHGLTGDGDCIPFRAIILYDVKLIGIE